MKNSDKIRFEDWNFYDLMVIAYLLTDNDFFGFSGKYSFFVSIFGIILGVFSIYVGFKNKWKIPFDERIKYITGKSAQYSFMLLLLIIIGSLTINKYHTLNISLNQVLGSLCFIGMFSFVLIKFILEKIR